MHNLALMAALLIAVLAMSASACASDDGAPAEGDDGAPAEGTVTIQVLDLEATVGEQLGGALLGDTDFGGTGVAGFTAIVDADPFSTVEVLGEVTQDWPSPDEANQTEWPWATGVAKVPAGSYVLRLVIGNDYCCYSRWVPALTPGLRLCEVEISTTGEDHVVEITGIPKDPEGVPHITECETL